MAQQIVRIVLQAVDQASSVIKKTEAEVVGFGDKAKSAFGELKTALSSRIFQGATLVGLGAALRKGWEESDNLEASMRKLGGTAKLTGTPLEFLTKIAQDAKQAFGLSTVQSNEFASSLARLAGRADRLDETGEALRGLLDVAAARGLNAEQALVAINQAILGIDEGTDKLFDKNPSVIYQEWADRAGKAAGKLTDTEKAQALLDEVLRGGEVTRGSYAEFLETAAGRSQQLANRTQDAAAEFGNATASLRDLLLPAATVAAEGLSGLIKVVQSIGAVVGTVFYGATEAIVGFASVVFEVIQGDFKGAFESGKKTLQNFKDLASGTAMNLEEIWKGSNTAITTDLDLHLTKRGTRQKEAGEDAEKLAKEQATELTKINDELAAKVLQIEHGLTEAQAKEMVRRARLLTGEQANMVKTLGEGYKQLDQFNLLLAAGFDKQVIPAVERTTVALVDIKDTSKQVFPAAKESLGKFTDAMDGADKAVDSVVTSIGKIDDEAGEVLPAIAELADEMRRIAGGDITGIIGAVGTVGGLFNTLFGDSASQKARDALQRHQESLDTLANQVGDLIDFNSSGRVLAGASSAISSIFDAATGRPRSGSSISVAQLAGALATSGLTIPDLLGLARDFNIPDLITNGQVDLAKLRVLFDLIQQSKPGQFGQDFASQLDFVTRGINLGAVKPEDIFSRFAGLADRFGATGITDILGQFNLTDPAGRQAAIEAFQQLFLDLNDNKVDPAKFGNLSGSQFLGLIERFIGLLSDPETIIGSGFTLSGGGGVSFPRETLSGPEVLPDPFPADLLLAPLDASAGLLAESVALLTSINDTLTKPIDSPAGALATLGSAARGSQMSIGAINVTVSSTGEGGVGLGTEIVDAIERELAVRLDRAYDNRGSAVRV